MVARLLIIMVMLGVMAFAATVEAASISVTSDRTEIQDNESFTLEYASDSSVDDDPDFSPIEKDFHIISRSQSSNIQFINGRLDRKTTWVLVLMPKAVGNFTIPAINFGSDRSQPISIKVTKATASKSNKEDLVYVEAFVDTKSAYVQSQIVYTLRIFHAVRFRNASLSELELSDKDASVEKLEENKKYSKFINGRRFQVFEKRYAIFPQTVGTLTIEPAVLDVQYIEAMRTLRNKRITSDRLTIDVKPIPEIIKNKKLNYWLPASNVILEENWSGDTDNLKIGEPLTRTVTLTATDLLSSALPDLSTKFPVKGLKHYPDQPVLDNKIVDTGFIGKRQEKIAYIPSEAGKVTLPEIKVYWWDTANNKMQKATLPERVITVAGGQKQLSETSSDDPRSVESSETGIDSGLTGGAGTESRAKDTSFTIGSFSGSVWFWISMLLLILWVATTGLWLNARRTLTSRSDNQSSVAFKAINSADTLKNIRKACDENDAQAAKQALIAWGENIWPDDPPTSLGHIAERVEGKLARELVTLNTALYKPGEGNWNRQSLRDALQKYIDDRRKQEKTRSSKIKPLFRIAST